MPPRPRPSPPEAVVAPEPRASVSRALDILDLFRAEDAAWSVERVCAALGVSVPTGYRYIRELVAAGLLARLPGGIYVLGPRIILLDYTIRQADPLLHVAVPIMRELVRRTGCDCVLSALLGDQILDTHRETGIEPLSLAYGRGRPRPMFHGASPKVILAGQSVARLRKIFARHEAEIQRANLGPDWPRFRSLFADIKRSGHYVSRGELEMKLSAIAVPIANASAETDAALAFVVSSERFDVLNLERMTKLLQDGVADIGRAFAAD